MSLGTLLRFPAVGQGALGIGELYGFSSARARTLLYQSRSETSDAICAPVRASPAVLFGMDGAGNALDKHAQLFSAFEGIEDKNALAWSVLDTKSESAVVRALALSINRTEGKRLAYVEYPPRVDMVFLEGERPTHAYEAKAAYATDFQEKDIGKKSWYLGPCIADDAEKLVTLRRDRYPSLCTCAALYFVYQVSAPSRQLKYGNRPEVPLARVNEVLRAALPQGDMALRRSIDCGEADGARVHIHMWLFDVDAEPDQRYAQ